MRKILTSLFLICALLTAGCSQNTDSSGLQPEKLIKLPLTRQATYYTCGVAVMQSVLYFNGIEYRQDVLAEELGATPEIGTNHKVMQAFLVSNGIGAVFEENRQLHLHTMGRVFIEVA